MKYFSWLWHNSRGIRWNSVVHIVAGSGLSEGQAQRIAIARGLLHGGDIFLLDEISNSLDETTEQELFARLFAAYPQKTILFITHRSAVSTLCDEVVKLDESGDGSLIRR